MLLSFEELRTALVPAGVPWEQVAPSLLLGSEDCFPVGGTAPARMVWSRTQTPPAFQRLRCHHSVGLPGSRQTTLDIYLYTDHGGGTLSSLDIVCFPPTLPTPELKTLMKSLGLFNDRPGAGGTCPVGPAALPWSPARSLERQQRGVPGRRAVREVPAGPSLTPGRLLAVFLAPTTCSF